jgi:hypothetical protein
MHFAALADFVPDVVRLGDHALELADTKRLVVIGSCGGAYSARKRGGLLGRTPAERASERFAVSVELGPDAEGALIKCRSRGGRDYMLLP